MSSTALDDLSRGRVVRIEKGLVVFQPAQTNYEHHLEGSFTGTTDAPATARLKARARKVYSVPSGGAFVVPILGTPRIVQGRVIALDDKTLYVKAGAVFAIALPTGPDAIDLNSGSIEVGMMVNAVLVPGASIELPG